MDLSEMDKGEPVIDAEFEEDDDDTDEEEELRDELDMALSLLRDTTKRLEDVIRLGEHGKIRYMLRQECIDTACEANAFLDTYTFAEDDKEEDEAGSLEKRGIAQMDMESYEWNDI